MTGSAKSGRSAAQAVLAVAVAGLALSGCVSSPTYGTGTPADQQLLEDLTDVLSLGPDNEERIVYAPRPEIVKPPSTAVLPPPQDNIASAGNPAWPESPEERLARIRAEATEQRDNVNFEPAVVNDLPRTREAAVRRTRGDDQYVGANPNDPSNTIRQRQAFQQRLAASRQGSPDQRRYLSEPPTDYRQPAASAPADELGVDEWRKERDAKAAARKKNGRTGLRDLVPWL